MIFVEQKGMDKARKPQGCPESDKEGPVVSWKVPVLDRKGLELSVEGLGSDVVVTFGEDTPSG